MKEKEVESEAEAELGKATIELVKDTIREANNIPQQVAGEKENLDIIKHLIKRLTVHQIILEDRANKMNLILLWLSVVMTISALFSILSLLGLKI